MVSAPTWLPERKVWSGGLAALVTWGIVVVAGRAGLDIPLELQAMIPAAIGYATSYLIPPAIQDILRRVNNAIVRLATADPENPTTAIVVPPEVVADKTAINAAVAAGVEATEPPQRHPPGGPRKKPVAPK